MQNTTLYFSLNSKHQLAIEPFERLPPYFVTEKDFFDFLKESYYVVNYRKKGR